MADTPFEIDFASIKSQAGDLLNQADNSEPIIADAPETPEVVAPVATTPKVASEKVAVAKEPAAVADVPTLEELDPDTHGDRLVKVKVDGQWEVKPLKDVVAGYSRTSHFTRQMQDLATQRKEFDGRKAEFDQLSTERQQIQAFLRNPKLVYQFLQERSPELFAAAEQTPVVGDPNEIATVQQARDLVEKQAKQFQTTLEQMEAKTNDRIAAATKELENRRETGLYAESINTAVKQIFEKFPILGGVRMAEDIIRFEVGKMQPKSITEALEAFHTVAEGMVEDLNEKFAATNKTKIVTAAKLAKAQIEPPGGSGPQIQPTTNFKRPDGTLDWTKLRQAAAAIAD